MKVTRANGDILELTLEEYLDLMSREVDIQPRVLWPSLFPKEGAGQFNHPSTVTTSSSDDAKENNNE
jgi:hypothetical protein